MEITHIIETVHKLLKSNDLVNEEATKMYLILPFLTYLGYEITSPEEVAYEYECDMHESGSRRVDCAVLDRNHTPLIIIEAEALNVDLDKHWGQAKSYLVSSEAQYAILTNGNDYNVFTRNQIDSTFYCAPPSHSFSLTNLSPDDFTIIRSLAKINIMPLCNIDVKIENLAEQNPNQRAYQFLCDWIMNNTKKFRMPGYVDSYQSEYWGIFECDIYGNPHTCCIIKSKFGEVLYNAGFDSHAFLTWANNEKKIRRDGDQYAKAKRITKGHAPVRCIYLKLPKQYSHKN